MESATTRGLTEKFGDRRQLTMEWRWTQPSIGYSAEEGGVGGIPGEEEEEAMEWCMEEEAWGLYRGGKEKRKWKIEGERECKREGKTQVEVVGDVGAVRRRSGERGEEEEGAGRVLVVGEEDEEADG